MDKTIARYERVAKSGDKDAKGRIEVLQKLRAALDDGKPARSVALADEERVLVRELFLLTMKPVLYIANVLEDGFEGNPHLDAVRARAAGEGAEVVPVSAAIEEELSQLDDADRDEFLKDLGLEEPGLNRVIRAAYKLLGLQTYFTAGVKEVRAWTVKAGATAPQAAAVIHTDFEKASSAPRPSPTATSSSTAAGGCARGGPAAPGRQGIPGAGRRRAALPLRQRIAGY